MRQLRAFYVFIWPQCPALGIPVPHPGIESVPWHWKPGDLTTEPPGKSLFRGILRMVRQSFFTLLYIESVVTFNISRFLREEKLTNFCRVLTMQQAPG